MTERKEERTAVTIDEMQEMLEELAEEICASLQKI